LNKDERIREAQNQARGLLIVAKIDEERINRVWEGFGDDYFLRHSATKSPGTLERFLKQGYKERPLVMASRRSGRRTEIFIYLAIKTICFALITSILISWD